MKELKKKKKRLWVMLVASWNREGILFLVRCDLPLASFSGNLEVG